MRCRFVLIQHSKEAYTYPYVFPVIPVCRVEVREICLENQFAAFHEQPLAAAVSIKYPTYPQSYMCRCV